MRQPSFAASLPTCYGLIACQEKWVYAAQLIIRKVPKILDFSPLIPLKWYTANRKEPWNQAQIQLPILTWEIHGDLEQHLGRAKSMEIVAWNLSSIATTLWKMTSIV